MKTLSLTEIDPAYTVIIMQYSNKGIIFVLRDKTTDEEVDRFLWEYPVRRGEEGNIRRFT